MAAPTSGSGAPATTMAAVSSAAQSTVNPNKYDVDLDDISDIDMVLLTLRKPTELKRVIDSIPKPIRAVPKNGLPMWYKLGLECKLPVPKMPPGKIIFSRGKLGEDVRRVGLGDGPSPSFDLTDPYCNNVSYDYVPMHDPHLAHHFAQKPAKKRMMEIGFCTKDGRAVCSLKEFNQYRKYLYNQFMDRIHMEMRKLDERARDDLTLKKVEADVARRQTTFIKAEKSREQFERHTQMHADEATEKRRRAREQEKKIKARMKYLAEWTEKNRRERAARVHEKETRIKKRVKAAAEMELRRKITMIRQWRTNEKRRVARLTQEREAKRKRMEDEADRKWTSRVESQNMKIQEENLLLKLYTEDATAGAKRRILKSENNAFRIDMALQRIRLANWKELHGLQQKNALLVKKMGIEFEKSKRGAKGMSREYAQRMATEAMAYAGATTGDTLMTLGQARARMDIETVLPSAPIRILDHMLESAIIEFARRRVNLLLRDVEHEVRSKSMHVIFPKKRPSIRNRSKPPRYSIQITAALAQQYVQVRGPSIAFGDVAHINPEFEIEGEIKKAKDRPPTPVPSLTKLAEVTFQDRVEDLPDPVAVGAYLPERKKLLEGVNTAAKLLSRSVSYRVQRGMDLTVGKVTLPHQRNQMEWGEAVEGLAEAVVNNRVHADCPDVRRTSEFLSIKVLRALQLAMRGDKERRKRSDSTSDQVPPGEFPDEPSQRDFYNPDLDKSSPNKGTNKTSPPKTPSKEGSLHKVGSQQKTSSPTKQ